MDRERSPTDPISDTTDGGLGGPAGVLPDELSPRPLGLDTI